MEYLIVPEPLTPSKDGEYDSSSNTWNSLIQTSDGNKHRERVECLILKNNKVFLAFDDDEPNLYRIPGGSTEPDVSLIQQLKDECKEESKIIIDNPKYMCTIKREYTYKEGRSEKAKFLKSVNYPNTSISYLYVARFKSRYKGLIDPYKIDTRIMRGKFYEYSQIREVLIPAHKYALDKTFNVL